MGHKICKLLTIITCFMEKDEGSNETVCLFTECWDPFLLDEDGIFR